MSDQHRLRIAKVGRDPIEDVPVYYVGCRCQWVAHDDDCMVPNILTLRDGRALWQQHTTEVAA